MKGLMSKRRRSFLRTLGIGGLAAAGLGLNRTAEARFVPAPAVAGSTGKAAAMGLIRQIHAGVLDVGYHEAGPREGQVVLLLHGWPYDIHSYVDVAPLLASAGYRVVTPYLRGYGTTRFLSDATPRNAQQAVLAADAIARIRPGRAAFR